MITVGLAILLFGSCGMVHAQAMAFAMRFTARKKATGTQGLLIALYILAAAHVAEAGLYALGFALGEQLGVGGFSQGNVNSLMDVFYFSIQTPLCHRRLQICSGMAVASLASSFMLAGPKL